jgi:dTDP-4-dehydrorhamnose 3,5-epimerase
VNVVETDLPGVWIIEPRVFSDTRGFFLETWRQNAYEAAGIPGPFVQDNHSLSLHRTLRGLHAQHRHAQGKLVRCIEGEIFDIAVDVRRGSPTFGRWTGVRLSSGSFRQLWVPPGFLHGFQVLSERAQVEYKCTDYYRPDDEIGVAWNDSRLAIDWPLADPILSAKDAALPRLSEIESRLPMYEARASTVPQGRWA